MKLTRDLREARGQTAMADAGGEKWREWRILTWVAETDYSDLLCRIVYIIALLYSIVFYPHR